MAAAAAEEGERSGVGCTTSWAEDTAMVAAAEEGERSGVGCTSREEVAVGKDVSLVICWLVGCCEDCLHN